MKSPFPAVAALALLARAAAAQAPAQAFLQLVSESGRTVEIPLNSLLAELSPDLGARKGIVAVEQGWAAPQREGRATPHRA